MTNPSTMAAPSGAVEASIDRVAIDDGDLPIVRLYINVYLVDRAYGGQEEGGWYYECGQPVESRLADNGDQAAAMYCDRVIYWKHHNKGRREISSVLSTGRFLVRREANFARHFPETIPHYE